MAGKTHWLPLFSFCLFAPLPLLSANYSVSDEPSFRAAITNSNANPGSTITFTVNNVNLSQQLPPITASVTIGNTSGPSVTITGGGNRIFFIESSTGGSITLQNLSLQGGWALGGNGGSTPTTVTGGGGGGGGLGAGGAMFVNQNASVSCMNVSFVDNKATGGSGGNGGDGASNGNTGGGGGGGLNSTGGNGGQPQSYGGGGGGGGGGDYTACPACSLGNLNGQDGSSAIASQQGGPGGAGGANGPAGGLTAPSSGNGVAGCFGGPATSPGAPPNCGTSSMPTTGQGGGGGGGGSSTPSAFCNPPNGGTGGAGGAGGDFAGGGGGGGGGNNDFCSANAGAGGPGGAGGFGGGGGGGASSGQGGNPGGKGGFGAGGGGGGGDGGGTSTYGGGTGGIGFFPTPPYGPGGGGAGTAFGGTIFVRSHGSITIGGNVTMTPAVTPLTAGTPGSGGGAVTLAPAGELFFVMSGGTLGFALSSNLTVSTNIAGDTLGVAGGGIVVNNSAGTSLILTGPNTYTGTTKILGGILQVQNDGNLGSAVNSITMGDPTLGTGGTLQTNMTFPTTRTIQLNANPSSFLNTIDVNSQTLTLIGPVMGSGNLSLKDSGGGGKLILTNATNNYSGGTIIQSGTLALTTGTLNTTGAVTVGTTAAVAIFDISGGASTTIGDFSGTTGGTVKLGTHILTVGTSNSTSYAGALNGTGGIVKQGSGTLTLTADNTGFAAPFTISGGVLKVANPNGLINITSITFNNATTLETTLDGTSTNANIFLTSGGGTFQVDAGTTTLGGTFGAGSSGTLTKSGAGTLLLSGANTNFTGPTNISGGKLTMTNVQSLGTTSSITFNGSTLHTTVAGVSTSSPINLSPSGGTIQVDVGTMTLNGAFGTGSSGPLTKTGAGMLSLGGANTNFTGSTTISNGKLQLTNAQSLGSTSSITFNGTTLQATVDGVSSNGPVNLGAISGTFQVDTGTMTMNGPFGAGSSGALMKTGAGTLVLGGANTNFTGTTTISNGTLKITNAQGLGNTSSITFNGTTLQTSVHGVSSNAPVDLGASPVTIQVDTGTTTLGGPITGTTTLTKTGAGTLSLSGSGNYNGPTTVQNGELNINGTLTSAITVQVGALLSGNATVGNVTNHGRLSPGNSIGTFNVIGNYVQTGDLLIEIEDAGASDLHSITGTANLSGSLTVSPLPGNFFAGTHTYTVLDAAGGVTGQFNPVNILDPQGQLQIGVLYVPTGSPTQVQLVVVNNQLFFGTLVRPYNPRQVELYFESIDFLLSPGVIDPAKQELIDIIEIMEDLGESDLIDALNQLQPAQFGAFALVNSNVSSFIASIVTRHPGELCCHHLEVSLPCGNASVWLEPFGILLGQTHVDDQTGFDSSTGGLLLGSNYSFENNILLGAALGFGNTNLSWHAHAGHAQIWSGYLSVFADWMWDKWYLESVLIGSLDNYDASRHIHFADIDRVAKNSHRGYDITGHLGAGVDIPWRTIYFQPFFNCDYSFLYQGGYSESGAGSLDLQVRPKSESMLRLEEGMYMTKSYEMKNGCWSSAFWLSWVSEFPIYRTHYIANMKGEPGSFQARSFGKVSNRISPGVEFAWKMGKCFSFSARYGLEAGRYLIVNKGDLRLEWAF